MRTTIDSRYSTALSSIQVQSLKVAEEQIRLSGGTRLLRASDSPLAIGRSVDMRTTLAFRLAQETAGLSAESNVRSGVRDGRRCTCTG